MENWSLFNNTARSLLSVSLVVAQLPIGVSAAEMARPFPVYGTVTVSEGHWNDTPAFITHLTQSVESEPIRFELESAAGEEYFRQGLLDESQKAFQRLLKARKPSPSVYTQQTANLRLAEIMILEGHADQALKRLNGLTRDSNPYIADEAYLMQARCFLALHQWDAMNKVITQLLHHNPAYASDLTLNLIRGLAALEQGSIDVALSFFQRYPEEPSALYYQGVCYIKKKEMSSALPIYQQILQKDSGSEWVDRMRLALGEAVYNAHDLTLAHGFFAPVTRPQADAVLRPLALHRQVCIYFEEKNFNECEKILPMLLKQYPNHSLRSQWTYLYASIPIFKKDWKKAIQEQKMALESPRGLAPQLHGVDTYQLKLSAEFRILWAHLLLNDFPGAKRLAETFINRYPKEQMTSYAYLAKGLALYRMGDYDLALDVYQDLLNKFPESSACGKAVYLMTLCLHSASDPFRMAGILNEVHNRMQVQKSENKRPDEWTENTLYWVADAYYQLNDLNNAEKIYQEFIQRSPQSLLVPYALEAMGSVMSAQGPQRDGQAVIALTQAQLRARDLNNKEFAEQVELELAKIYYNQREFSKAGAAWNHIAETAGQSTVREEALYRQGDALSRQDYYVEAIKSWRTLVHTYKTSTWVPEALMRIGTTQAGLGQWPDATSTFKTLKQSYPKTQPGKEAAFQLVQCAFNQGDLPQSVVELLTFSKDYGDDPRIPKAADNLLSAFHQRKISISPAQQAQLLKLAPGSAGGAALLWERGAQLFNEGKYEPAQKLFEKIMLSYPNDEYAPLAYFYNADCFFWMKRWDDAANAYQNFYLSFPKHERVPNAMFQKAVCLFRKGSFDDAVADFDAFIKKYPNHALAKEAWLNIALAHKKAFQLDKAIEAYKYVIGHYGNDQKINAVWLQMGSLLEVQGKRTDALHVYARIPSSAPEYAEALYHEVALYEQAHNPAQVRHTLELLRGVHDKRNEFRVAGLVKLSEMYEQEGAPPAKLRALYEELRASSNDPEIVKQSTARLQELK